MRRFSLLAVLALYPWAGYAGPAANYAELATKGVEMSSELIQKRLDYFGGRCGGRLQRAELATCLEQAKTEYDAFRAQLIRSKGRVELGKYEFDKKRFPVYVYAELGRSVVTPVVANWPHRERERPTWRGYLEMPDLAKAEELRNSDRDLRAELVFRIWTPVERFRNTGTVEVDLLGVSVKRGDDVVFERPSR